MAQGSRGTSPDWLDNERGASPFVAVNRYQALYDKYLPKNWRERLDDPTTWRAVDTIPDSELWNTHQEMKNHLADFVNHLTANAARTSTQTC